MIFRHNTPLLINLNLIRVTRGLTLAIVVSRETKLVGNVENGTFVPLLSAIQSDVE